MTVDLGPHFESVARSARLTGMVRGYRHALRVLEEAGQRATPAYHKIERLLMTADEDFASRPAGAATSDGHSPRR